MNNFSNLFLKLTLISSISFFTHTCHGACNPLDHDSLSSFHLSFSSSPPRLDWSLSVDCCDWEGITCDGGSGRVTSLWLPTRGLVGTIPPSILNLTALTQLSLSNNSLLGPLPARFFKSLTQLQVVDLSLNHLIGELNSSDALPAKARIFNVSSNNFYGPIQTAFIETGLNLETFDVSMNGFTGPVPSSICSFLPSIKRIDFTDNYFTGSIPRGFGQCTNLLSLRAGFNNLSAGSVPGDIYGLLPLEELYLPCNMLTGPIDPSLFNLTNLKSLALFGNELTGPIPEEIGNLFKLERLELHNNLLNGTVPNSLANCTNLTLLNMRVNLLGGELSSLNFSRFVRLKTVDLGDNFFTGNLPRALFSCKTLTAVRLAVNKLSGEFVPEVASLPFLSILVLSNNNLTNVTSAVRILSGCKNLRTLVLSTNFYGEALTEDPHLVGFQSLQMFCLSHCNLTGRIPTWMSELNEILGLDLSHNFLTGFVPGWFGGLPNLVYLDLGYNRLTGGFPTGLVDKRLFAFYSNSSLLNDLNLELPVSPKPGYGPRPRLINTAFAYMQRNVLSLANNGLNGPISPVIGQLKYVVSLDLSGNNFSGRIPDTISSLVSLERLDISENSLTGEIPASLQNLNFLSYFDVSNNDLEGPVPTGGQFSTFPSSSFEGNPRLCGQILQRSCSNNTDRSETARNGANNPKKRIILSLVISSAIFATILLVYLYFPRRRIIPKRKVDEKYLDTVSFNSSVVFPDHHTKESSLVVMFPTNESSKMTDLVTIAEILRATDNFNQANIIGRSGFGMVFRATLSDGSNVAIKKLPGNTGLIEREFKAEVEALSTAQHKNIVTLQGYCLHDGYRLLIYSRMENGSLDYWLHDGPDGLSWPARLKIARGASDGVAYMHETCEPHIVHRDLKSSNILLDRDFEARVADFGLARLIMADKTHVSTELVGTLGYVPPEYSQLGMATLRGDMYSFGVVMLELLTGKRPVVEEMPSNDLVAWVQKMKKEGRWDEIFDPMLRGKGFEDEMARVLDVACMCVTQNPFDRPTIKDVVDWLNTVGPDRQTADML